MFESLKHWLEAEHHYNAENSHFEHPEEAKVHVALASLLYHIMDVDHRATPKEKKSFTQILEDEFGLNAKQIDELYQYVGLLKSDLKADLATVEHYLKKTPTVRMDFMAKLNHLIGLDGIQTGELDIFYDAMSALFPEVSVGSNR